MVQGIKVMLIPSSHMCIGEQHAWCHWDALSLARTHDLVVWNEHHLGKVVLREAVSFE